MIGDLVSDYTVEVVYDYTPEFIEYVVDLCDRRSKELKELNDNYTSERIRHCFISGRFKHGFYIVKLQEEVLATFGVDDFCGWGVMCRYLVHKPGKWLYLLGVSYPFVEHELAGKVIGVCHTQNRDSRKIRDTMVNRLVIRGKCNRDLLTTIGAATEVFENTRKLNYEVWYRGTVQEVVTYYTDLIPPFERYSGSF